MSTATKISEKENYACINYDINYNSSTQVFSVNYSEQYLTFCMQSSIHLSTKSSISFEIFNEWKTVTGFSGWKQTRSSEGEMGNILKLAKGDQ